MTAARGSHRIRTGMWAHGACRSPMIRIPRSSDQGAGPTASTGMRPSGKRSRPSAIPTHRCPATCRPRRRSQSRRSVHPRVRHRATTPETSPLEPWLRASSSRRNQPQTTWIAHRRGVSDRRPRRPSAPRRHTLAVVQWRRTGLWSCLGPCQETVRALTHRAQTALRVRGWPHRRPARNCG